VITSAGAIALWLGAFVMAWFFTARVRAYAVAREILDYPNARSSHDVPTPRGGGLAIVLVVELCIVLVSFSHALPPRTAIALAGGSALIALVGWLDDRRSLRPRARLAVHLLAAVSTVALLGGLPTLAIGPYRLALGVAGSVLAVLIIVWLLNLWNFMDGIDGIAGGEGLIAGIACGLLLWPVSPGLALVALAISAACGGFLVLNWQPAKIFMGDVGSATIGFLFATLALSSERAGATPIVAFCLILGTFIFDATLTLIRRVLAGEAWHQAHRAHAYQRAVQSGRTHREVSGASAVITVLLAVGAWLMVRWPAATLPIVLLGVLMVLALYLWVERVKPYRPPAR
jgi:Fuc2NAc and GlcNAc transferase